MKIICSGICDIGLKRKINQDSICMYSNQEQGMSLFAVADGMGGHSEGEVASRTIIENLKYWAMDFNAERYDGIFSKMMKSLEEKIEEISREIYRKYNQTQICGSTCILLFIYNDCYGVINVGDSRIYKKDGWKIKSIMKDDVWENKIEVAERFSRSEIENHANYGKLLQAVGIKEDIILSSKTDLLKKGDFFMLCSDGLYKFCSEKKIKKVLKHVSEGNIERSAKELIEECYEEGARDNISVIIVKCL